MIKYLLAAILTLAIIGGAFSFKTDDQSWQIIVHKEEAFKSVTNGALRIYKIGIGLVSDAEMVEKASILLEES
jgi:hypothetical protein